MRERDFDIDRLERGAEQETGCNLDISVVKEQATWYAVANTLALVFGSGMGLPLDDHQIAALCKSSGLSANQSPVVGAQPLKAVFRSADPSLAHGFDEQDWRSWRWIRDGFDRTLVPQAQGWTILQEIECAKWFSIPVGAQGIDESLQLEWEARAMMLSGLAQRQCEFTFENMRNDQGLFIRVADPDGMPIDETTVLQDQMCMLWACSALSGLLGNSDRFSLFADADAAGPFTEMANRLFLDVSAHRRELFTTSVRPIVAGAVAVRALIWFASNTNAPHLRTSALQMLREFADGLVQAQDRQETVGDTVFDAGAALSALVDAYRVTKLRTYAETSTKVFDFIESQWWELAGTYSPTPLANEYTYNVEDIGAILGALNASRLYLHDRVERELAELRMRVFFCEAVNLSGLQMSMPDLTFLPEWLREREPSLHFRHGSIPLPSEVNAAPVLAGEVSYDPQSDTWSRRGVFDTSAAMRTCCEFMWMDDEAVNGFPQIHRGGARSDVRQVAPSE